ncbi:MAG: hypothetical protein HP492_16535 [Nitrospira sp.]|nr:hypothetical protein [Nitrospira sp.]
MNRAAIVYALKGGNRRSIGRSNQVVAIVRRQPALFPALINGMHDKDEIVRMRAADAAEKLTVSNPQWLQPFKRRLLKLATEARQQELRWHLAQMLPRLEWSERDRTLVVATLRAYLADRSRIVKTFAMQGLANLAMRDSRLRTPIRRLISSLTQTGSPSVKSRGRRLLVQLDASALPRPAPISR